MMQVYHSNRAEQLVQRLAQIVTQPPADPLAPETVVVQNPGMARWLAQQLALQTGIAANLEFPLPASFAWRIQAAWMQTVPEESGYDRQQLQWRVLALLPRFLPQPAFAPLHRYLKDDESDLKAYQLAGRIADVFDQYLVYRPDMVLGWEAGREDDWQAELWRAVAAGTGGMHRAGIFAEFRAAVGRGEGPRTALPERVSLFGLTALAPVHLHAFTALARHAAVHVFLLNPSAEYWTDIVDERGQARRRARWRQSGGQDLSGLLDVGNPLLASMGHTGQGFLDQLLDLGASDQDLFEDPGETTLLASLQHDILHLNDRRQNPTHLPAGDRSVQVHACHTPMREVQVLRDRLLAFFEHLPDLRPREIVVMAPDIDIYAPHLEAVFEDASQEQYIPWTVADRRLPAEQPVIETLLGLLDLPAWRLTASEVLGLLEVPAVSRRFGFNEESLSRVRAWVEDCGIRWGADAAMRAADDLPAEAANTWEAGLARLFLGYAMPPEEVFFSGTLSHPDVEGAAAADLGALQTLVDRLAHWRAALCRPAGAGNWLERVNRLVDDLLAPDDDEAEAIQAVRRVLGDLGREASAAGLDTPLQTRVVRAHLEACLSSAGGARRFLLGGVTFCNMVPMRAIPFRVVCLLGLNDIDFPRRQHPPGFDRIAADPRPGDRSRRLDDRYLFLEALLSARDVFYLSYLGSDVRDNSPRVPSVVVSELLDYLDQGWTTGEEKAPSTRLVCRHPLQPFSLRLFDGRDPALFSYDRRWLEAAAGPEPEAAISPFMDGDLPPPEEDARTVALDELVGFFLNPAARFLERRLGIRLEAGEGPPADEEPFDLAGLERYLARDELVPALIVGQDVEIVEARIRARGRLPHGRLGAAAWTEALEGMDQIAETARKARGTKISPLEIDLTLGRFTLRGWLKDLTDRGRLAVRPATVKAKDRLRLWILHLVLCAAAPTLEAAQSLHIGLEEVVRFGHQPEAARLLKALLERWWQGQSSPLSFFPETSWTYAATLARTGNEDEAFKACQRAWQDDYRGIGDAFDSAVQLAWRGRDPLGPAFMEIAVEIFGPLIDATEAEAAP